MSSGSSFFGEWNPCAGVSLLGSVLSCWTATLIMQDVCVSCKILCICVSTCMGASSTACRYMDRGKKGLKEVEDSQVVASSQSDDRIMTYLRKTMYIGSMAVRRKTQKNIKI